MLANAAVHLYKLNPTTRGYDAVEGGGLLGCVLMGSGLNFQLLIYNSQVCSYHCYFLHRAHVFLSFTETPTGIHPLNSEL